MAKYRNILIQKFTEIKQSSLLINELNVCNQQLYLNSLRKEMTVAGMGATLNFHFESELFPFALLLSGY